jgi:hypothetical protein
MYNLWLILQQLTSFRTLLNDFSGEKKREYRDVVKAVPGSDGDPARCVALVELEIHVHSKLPQNTKKSLNAKGKIISTNASMCDISSKLMSENGHIRNYTSGNARRYAFQPL